jgi:hypothetical protein
MANMSYIRFENTYKDLLTCFAHLNDGGLSDSEYNYRARLVALCQNIVDEFDPEEWYWEADEDGDEYGGD